MTLSQQHPRLQISAIRDRYNDLTKYNRLDPWHRFTAERVRHEVSASISSHGPFSELVLNAGAGGNDLGLSPTTSISLDISEKRIMTMANPIVASVEMLPFQNSCFDAVICVGSVINYCDAAAVISEFGRVLRPEGYLIFDFDSSDSAEFIKHDAFRRSAGVVETFYGDEREVLWLYSPRYMQNLLSAMRIHLVRSIPIHILSPWILFLFNNISFAAAIAHLDHVARYVSPLVRFSSNHFYLCQKTL